MEEGASGVRGLPESELWRSQFRQLGDGFAVIPENSTLVAGQEVVYLPFTQLFSDGLKGTGVMKILYFARFRERLGCAEELWQGVPPVTTIQDLVTALVARGRRVGGGVRDPASWLPVNQNRPFVGFDFS